METMEHLFLMSLIAQKLWENFAFCAGMKLHGMQLQHLITNWWTITGPIKIQRIFKIVPAILLWELWKRRNARRHDKDVSLFKLIQQCQHTINQFIRDAKGDFIFAEVKQIEITTNNMAEAVAVLKALKHCRKGNQLADALANNAYNHTEKQEYKQFNHLPGLILARKGELPILHYDSLQTGLPRVEGYRVRTEFKEQQL
ncbi:hypothetical protein KY284_007986 [Solanum tuberosum]|nr:hypothetical protein KY284_007986 [Solanum tuberosum]